MSAKPSVIVVLLALYAAPAAHAAPAVPTVVLFPRSVSSPDDAQALSDVRRELRRDNAVDVLTFDPNGSAFKRAAADAHRPDWLTSVLDDAGRASVTRGVGAQFYATVGQSDRGRADIRLVNAGGSGYAWVLTGQKSGDAARQLETDMAGAIDYAATLSTPMPVPPVKIIQSTPPAPVTVTVRPAQALPSVAAPAPVVVKTVTPPVPLVTQTAKSPVPLVTQTAKTPAPPAQNTPHFPAAIPLRSYSAPTPVVVRSYSAPARNLLTPPAAPAPAGDNTTPAPDPADVRAAAALTAQADDALARSDPAAAVSLLRQAVNLMPLSAAPRVKLARAYLQAGLPDRAADEARRAAQIAPADPSVQQLLTDTDAATGTSNGAVARATALLSQAPDDPAALVALADAQSQNGDDAQAEASYRDAVRLAPEGSSVRAAARAHLARFYAAQSRYTDCLTALHGTGRTGYALALTIVQTRADALSTALDTARAQFDTGKSTHEAFYKAVSDALAQAQGLSGFVAALTPPPTFSLSHAHRVLAAQLLAQQAATLVSYVETGSGTQAQRASELEKAAQTEMLTAHAAETTLGLWNNTQSANN